MTSSCMDETTSAVAMRGLQRRAPRALFRATSPPSLASVAEQVNKLGRFNAVIHNAGIGYREPRQADAEPGVPSVFAINVLAPYILTALIERPDRLVYVSSGMHRGVVPRMD